MRTRTVLASAVVGLLALGASMTARADYKSTVLADNPPGYWRLDNFPPVILSYATNIGVQAPNLNGVIQNYVREGLPGAIAGDANTAMQFIGLGSSQISVPYDVSLNQGGSFTFECWMNPACVEGNALALVVNRNGESGYTIYINGDGTFGFNMDRGAPNYWASCVVTNPPMVMTNLVNKWTHVACVYDSDPTLGTNGFGVEYIYFNGVLMATNAITLSAWIPNNGGPFLIGNRNYSGLLDEVAAYSVVLTPAQLLAHYQAGTNGLGQYKTVVLNDNPDGYWRLGETGGFTPQPVLAQNIGTIGSLYNGTYDIGVRLQQPGAIAASTNKSVLFDGLKAMWAPPGVAPNPIPPFSVEFWAKPTQTYAGAGTDQSCPLASTDRDFGRSGWIFYQGGNGWSWYLGNTVGYTITMDPTITVTNINQHWSHVVGTFDGTNAILYVNGVQIATAAGAFTPNQDKPLTIGIRYDGSYGFQGNVDEVAVYNTLLSASDVAAHYQNGTNAALTETSYSDLVSAKNPLDYYRLNENSTATYPGVANSGWLGSDVDGSLVGTVVPSSNTPLVGDADASGDFTGGGRIAIPYNEALFRTNAFSYECWYEEVSGSTTSYQCPMWWRDEPVLGDTRGWVHYNVSSANTFQSSDVYTTWNGLNTSLLWQQGVWQHLVCTFDGKTKKIYINGVLGAVSTNAVLAVKPVQRAVATISSASYPWNGNLDEVAVYTNALSADRVQAHYVAATGVNPPAVAPTFFVDAMGTTGFEGATITVPTVVLGTPPFTYQWYKGTTAVAGQTTDTLTLSPAHVSDSGDYKLTVSNSGGSMDSAIATVTVVQAPPSIITDLVPAVRAQGASVTFMVEAGGSQPLNYQWKSNSVAITAPNTNTLTLNNIQPSFAANYSVFISNAAGNTNSSAVSLTVEAVAAGSYAATVVADGPIAFWRLDDTNTTTLIAHDYAGGYDGTYDSSVTLGQPSAIMGDTDFSATFNYVAGVVVPFNPDLNPYSTFSLEAWAKPDPNGMGNDRPILASSTSASGWAYGYILAANTSDNWYFTTGQKTSGFDTIATTNSAATNAGWTHLVCTMDDATSVKCLYVNGQLVAQDAPASGTFAPNQVTATGTPPTDQGIGWNPVSSGAFWGGLDEVAFYGYPLTAAQVTQHYAKGALPSLTITPPLAGKVTITWSGMLLQATDITGPWTTNTTAVSPMTITPSGARVFYRSLVP